MSFKHLFTPIKIGTKTARNRIIFPCHSFEALSFPDYIAYEVARAKGGCGLVIIGPCVVHYSGATGGEHLHTADTPETLIPSWKAMSKAVHEYGTLVLVQLWHIGDKSEGLANVSWGVSENPINNDLGRAEVPHEMTDAEINEIIDGFAMYAKAARDAGLDGCEIHGSHGYLPQQFWSPWVNHRKDRWSEPLAFIKEVVGRIREAAGKDFIIGVRMSGDDLYPGPGGIDAQKSRQIAQALEATGNVDFLNISVGHGGNSNAYTVTNMYIPPASISVPLTSGIKQGIKSIPVIAVGRINDPTLAENAIADGHCDMVGLVRGQIADAEFCNKAREGRLEDIRLCIACNQGCNVAGRPNCTQNLVSGRENTEIAVIKPAPLKKKVVVVGGGPAGMESARVADIRGHQVTLFEKDSKMGGQINILSRAPGREEFSQVVRFLAHQIEKSGIKVVLGSEASLESILLEQPDAVIVATGARPYIEPVPGCDASRLFSPYQVLQGNVNVGRKVLIYENTPEMEGQTVADYLAERGVQVELITSLPSLGAGLMTPATLLMTYNPIIWRRLRKNGANITTHTKIKEMSGNRVTLIDCWSDEESTIDNVDSIIMSTGYLPNSSLYKSLQGKIKELYAVGDCVTPKRVPEAIHNAYLTAIRI
jgi:2,4-dienoyl-CoA reductase-like NADH-dependent reductase (Old Yellow Enzyme family)/thioredoxin reductase